MSTSAVSILVPFYNPGEFLAEALESVFAQSFLDWELILVNDGSTDISVAAARSFAEREPARVGLIGHPDAANHGLPATRNLGIRYCRGEFVALLDADDFWFPEKLKEQVAILRANPEAGMVFGRSEYWHSWDPQRREDDTIPKLVPGDRIYQPLELWKLCYPFGEFGAPCPSDLLLRRSAIEQVNGFEESFDARSPTHEDIAFLSKIFLTVPVYVSNQCWDRYRRHDNSMWAAAQQDGGEERSRAFYFEWMANYLEKCDVKDEVILELYREKSWRYRHSTFSACADGVRAALRPLRQAISRKS
jgi:glycosyltransferase involved in cell wall biosynthesis